ncbi:cation:proton antiporter [bacterium]|nr:cation:proton antiporter [bacterium]
MRLLIAIAIFAVISLVGSKVTFLDRRLPLGFRHILFTGAEYIFIGILLGSMGLNVLDEMTLKDLQPFLIFGLSWIGFLYGVQFEVRFLRKLPRYFFSITAIQATGTFFFITGLMFLALNLLLGYTGPPLYILSVTLGATGACTAQSAIALISRNYRIKNRGLLELLRYISSVDGLFAVLFFAIALSIAAGYRNIPFSVTEAIWWLLVAVIAGIAPAAILILLSQVRFSQQEYLVFLVGTIMFSGGLSRHLNQSPLISGLVFGIIVANLCRHRLRAIELVSHAEKSIYIILLLFLGASWRLSIDLGLLLGLCYLVFRLMGKLSSAWLAITVFKPLFKSPRILGLGLISEGGLAVAITLEFYLLNPSLANTLISIIIISILVNELLSPRLILAQFPEAEKL